MRLAIIAFMLLVGIAIAVPSDLIDYKEQPAIMPLSGATPASALAIDGTNEQLGAYRHWEMPNIGKLASWVAEVSQEDYVGIPTVLTNFSTAAPVELEDTSIGNTSANATVINETFVWY